MYIVHIVYNTYNTHYTLYNVCIYNYCTMYIIKIRFSCPIKLNGSLLHLSIYNIYAFMPKMGYEITFYRHTIR